MREGDWLHHGATARPARCSAQQHGAVLFPWISHAIGLAEQTMRVKKPKSIDMRFDWIQDRVRQNQFKVVFVSGGLNMSDFLTKAFPVHVHQEMAPMYVREKDDGLRHRQEQERRSR